MSDGSVTIDTKLNNNEFKKGINELESIGKKGLKGLGVAIGIAVTGLSALGGYAIKVGSDFEAGMSKVQAISGATQEEINKLTEKAKEMGAKTKFSASESAEAFQYMAMAGWKTGDMLNGIEGIMNLATASGENLASVSDIVTDALTAFGLQAKDSSHFADVLAKASSSSNTNVGLMGATFKYVAPIAGSMKYSIEDTAVAIGLMANAGIKGEQAGTALRSMLTRLVKPPKEAAEALKKLNISAKNSDGTMKPLSQTLKELRTKFSKLNDNQKASYASSIAGTEAMSGMLAIVNASNTDFEKLTKEINNSEGATKKMADTMNNNLKGATTIMKSNMESLGIAIYDKFKGPATKGIKSVTEVLEKLTKSTSSGKLSRSLDKIANSFGKLIEKGGDLIAKVLPKLIDGFAWVLDNGGTIAKAIGTITAAMLYFKTTANISKVVQGFQNAQVALSLFTLQAKGATVAQGVLNGSLTLGETAVALLTGKISLATVAQKLWNMAMSANPIGVLTVAVAGLTAGLIYLATRQTETEKKAKEFAEEMKETRISLEEYNKSIDDTAKANLAQINSTSKLRNELETLVDENGKVKEGYEGRVSFILKQLNSALGTEYKLNGNVVESYKDIQNEIDGTIKKKKAEIILNAEQEKYAKAVENEENAVKNLREAHDKLGMSLEEAKTKLQNLKDKAAMNAEGNGTDFWTSKEIKNLENLISGYEEAESTVKQCVENKKNYESDYALFAEGKYEEIGKTITDTTSNWADSSLAEIRSGIENQQAELQISKELYERYGSEVSQQQMEQAKINLQNLASELAERTKTVGTLGKDETEAWRILATSSHEEYAKALSKVGPTTQKEIQIATGVVVSNTELENASKGIANDATEKYETELTLKEATKKAIEAATSQLNNDTTAENASKNMANDMTTNFKNRLKLSGKTQGEVAQIASKLNNDSLVGNAAADLGKDVDRNFNKKLNGWEWGWHLVKNIHSGLTNQNSKNLISSGASTIGSIINSFLHHTTPDKGPLKDDDKWMSDMIDNFVVGIKTNAPKMYKQIEEMAKRIENELDLTETYNKMQATVDFETARLSTNLTAQATLKASKEQPIVIARDHTVHIDNTQNFYEKNTTPYEQQKQAKQQLRRLAYGL